MGRAYVLRHIWCWPVFCFDRPVAQIDKHLAHQPSDGRFVAQNEDRFALAAGHVEGFRRWAGFVWSAWTRPHRTQPIRPCVLRLDCSMRLRGLPVPWVKLAPTRGNGAPKVPAPIPSSICRPTSQKELSDRVYAAGLAWVGASGVQRAYRDHGRGMSRHLSAVAADRAASCSHGNA